MLLNFANGEPFSLGVMPYEYRPATSLETSPRIIVTIQVGQYALSAFVDTGGVYFLCAPSLARRVGLEPSDGIAASDVIRWRGSKLRGLLYRLPITLQAMDGESLTIEATAFVPQLAQNEEWDDALPCVLGMQFCLERMRFAVDPQQENFYFGEIGGGL